MSSLSCPATQITLENGYELKFENGTFNPITFNMNITKVEIFQNGKCGWYKNGLTFDTTLLADGRTFIFKSMIIDSFVLKMGSTKVGNIIARNLKLGKHEDFLE